MTYPKPPFKVLTKFASPQGAPPSSRRPRNSDSILRRFTSASRIPCVWSYICTIPRRLRACTPRLSSQRAYITGHSEELRAESLNM